MHSLTKKAYLEQKALNLDWYRSINSCLQTYDRGDSKVASVNVFSNLRTIFINNWESTLLASPKLEFYSTCKTKFNRESYLAVPTFKLRSALTRLRISAHDLEIERGRYQSKLTKPDSSQQQIKKATKHTTKSGLSQKKSKHTNIANKKVKTTISGT